MTEEVRTDAEAVARRAASVIAEAARAAVRERGRFLLAASGGATRRKTRRLPCHRKCHLGLTARLANKEIPGDA